MAYGYGLGLGLGLGGSSGGGAPAPTPEEEFLAAIDGSANSAFFDFTTADDNGGAGPLTVNDLSSNGNDITRNSGYPVPAGADGVDFNTLNAQLIYSLPNGDSTLTVIAALTKDPASNAGRIVPNNVRYGDGEGINHVGCTVTIDDGGGTNQNSLHDELDDGAEHIMRILGLDWSTTAVPGNWYFGQWTSSYQGKLRRVAVIDEVDFPTNLAEVRDLGAAAVAAGN